MKNYTTNHRYNNHNQRTNQRSEYNYEENSWQDNTQFRKRESENTKNHYSKKYQNWNAPEAEIEENWDVKLEASPSKTCEVVKLGKKSEYWNVPEAEIEENWDVKLEASPSKICDMVKLGETIPSLSVSDIWNEMDIEIRIGSIYDPYKFWFILSDGYENLDKLMDELQVAYANKSQNLKIPEEDIKPDIYCVSLYNEEYHRGMVKKVMPEKNKVSVFFVDYGIVDIVDFHEVFFLAKSFGQLAQQAVRARLSGVQPAVAKMPWSLEARDYFIEKVEDQVVKAKVCYVDKDNQVVEVILTVNSICVNDALKMEKIAIDCFYLSEEAIRPSFHELEDEVMEPPLPQAELLLKFVKPTTVRESKLHENPVCLIFIHNKIYISIFEMIRLTKLGNKLSVRSVKEILASNCAESLHDVEIPEEDVKMQLESYGIKSENSVFSLIPVEFIPEFFKMFTDIVFPHALFETFLNEIYTLL